MNTDKVLQELLIVEIESELFRLSCESNDLASAIANERLGAIDGFVISRNFYSKTNITKDPSGRIVYSSVIFLDGEKLAALNLCFNKLGICEERTFYLEKQDDLAYLRKVKQSLPHAL